MTGRAARPDSFARSRIALERGCSLFCSTSSAASSNSRSPTPWAQKMSVTRGCPWVIVPVLSKAATFIFPASSKAAAVLKRIPFFAATPLATIIATGVARPNAQGQLMTKTLIARASENPKSFPAKSHAKRVAAAIAITAGTKTPETLSAIFCAGAFVAAAPSTIFIIWLIVVSWPTLVARHFKKPAWFKVPPVTLSPSFLSTARLSPVKADSSTAPLPSKTIPSTGRLWPGRTTKMSPALTSSIGTVISVPSLTSVATFGESFIKAFSAFVVFPLERASSNFPTVIKARIIAAPSK